MIACCAIPFVAVNYDVEISDLEAVERAQGQVESFLVTQTYCRASV